MRGPHSDEAAVTVGKERDRISRASTLASSGPSRVLGTQAMSREGYSTTPVEGSIGWTVTGGSKPPGCPGMPCR